MGLFHVERSIRPDHRLAVSRETQALELIHPPLFRLPPLYRNYSYIFAAHV